MESEATIFYMDMRTYGREYQRYMDQAKEKYGVKFVRCRVHSVEKDGETHDPKLSYMDDRGNQIEESFDLVVLATGKQADNSLPGCADSEGVHVVTSDLEFKDISETIIESSSTVAGIEGIQNITIGKKTALSKEVPRFLVVVCRCGSSGKKSIASDTLIQTINKLPGHIKAIPVESVCSTQGFENMISQASEHEFNRLIVMSCNSELFRSKSGFIEEKTGIHRHHMDFLESDSDDENRLLSKIMGSYASVKTRNTHNPGQKKVVRHCVILGAGPAGLAAADILGSYNIPVTLIEKEKTPGGNLRYMTGEPEQSEVNDLLARVTAHPETTLVTESELSSWSGHPGCFSATVKTADGFNILPAGAVIIATGGERKNTAGYGYDDNKVINLFDLEQKLDTMDFRNKHTVMIQCVDSREEPDNYCSRICCVKALNTAIKVKEKNPDAEITILYRDIMTTGTSEKIYTEARKKGIRFIPYSKESKPVLKPFKNHTRVTLFNPVIQEKVQIKADLVSLSTGIRPRSSENLTRLFGLKKTPDGFIQETDYKWRPVDTGKEGVFVCGLARRALGASDAVKEGRAAAVRALRILNREVLETQMISARVRHTLCSRCELCIDSCPYSARFIDPESLRIQVDDTSCQACGTCASVCPNNATVISGFEDSGVMSQIENMI